MAGRYNEVKILYGKTVIFLDNQKFREVTIAQIKTLEEEKTVRGEG